MATHPVIDDLDRCKIALQYLAERQSDSLGAVFELLLERLEDAPRRPAAISPVAPRRRGGSGRRGGGLVPGRLTLHRRRLALALKEAGSKPWSAATAQQSRCL